MHIPPLGKLSSVSSVKLPYKNYEHTIVCETGTMTPRLVQSCSFQSSTPVNIDNNASIQIPVLHEKTDTKGVTASKVEVAGEKNMSKSFHDISESIRNKVDLFNNFLNHDVKSSESVTKALAVSSESNDHGSASMRPLERSMRVSNFDNVHQATLYCAGDVRHADVRTSHCLPQFDSSASFLPTQCPNCPNYCPMYTASVYSWTRKLPCVSSTDLHNTKGFPPIS